VNDPRFAGYQQSVHLCDVSRASLVETDYKPRHMTSQSRSREWGTSVHVGVILRVGLESPSQFRLRNELLRMMDLFHVSDWYQSKQWHCTCSLCVHGAQVALNPKPRGIGNMPPSARQGARTAAETVAMGILWGANDLQGDWPIAAGYIPVRLEEDGRSDDG
jgi:hypothetical protein